VSETERMVRVSFRKQVSDGNYGTEAAEVTLEWPMADCETVRDDDRTAARMLEEARELVQQELMQSPNANVRRLFQPRTTAPSSAMRVPSDYEDDD
jgi:hypothetical protein